MRGLPDYQLPSLAELRDTALLMARVVNPAAQVVGVSINTSSLSEADANKLLGETEDSLGLPAVDPFRHGADRLAEALEKL